MPEYRMRRGLVRRPSNYVVLIGILLTLSLLAVAAGRYIAQHQLSYREAISVLLILAILFVLRAGSRTVQIGFFLWVCTLGLGYRTIQITSNLSLHPSEVIVWVLFLLLVAQSATRHEEVRCWFPIWLFLLVPFWLWAWLPGLQVSRPWDLMLSEFRDFFLLIPLFFVAQTALRDKGGWRPLALAFFATGTWIGGMGLLEYFFPALRVVLPGFVSDPAPLFREGGYLQASFSFWGTPLATLVCLLSAPMSLIVWESWSAPRQRLLTMCALVIQIAGIYIGAERAIWFLLAVEFFVWAMFRYGLFRGLLLALPIGAIYPLLPLTIHDRILSLIAALQGRSVDSSAIDRWNRAMTAWNLAITHPSGNGWAGSGWVHSDFIQTAANQGLLAGFLFAAAYLVTAVALWRLLFVKLHRESQTLTLALFLSFIAAGGLLAVEGLEVLPQLILPVWFVWVLAEIRIRQISNPREVPQ